MQRLTSAFLVFLFFVPFVGAQSLPTGEQPAMLGFGGAIALSQGRILVGSASVDWPAGADPAGEVFIFERGTDGAWTEAGRLGASDATYGDEFGRSITADGDMLYVGAPAMGTVYVFRFGGDSWTQERVIEAPRLPEGAEFAGGYARGGYRTQTIARVGDVTAVTSYNQDTNEGAVHFFGQNGTIKTVSQVPAWSVAAMESTLFVGAPTADENRGMVLVMEVASDGSASEQLAISASDLDAGAMLGRALAVEGSRLYVSAIKQGGSGAVLVFERAADAHWRRTHTITQPVAEGSRPAGDFGRSLAVAGGHLVITAQNTAFVVETDNLDGPMVRLERPQAQRGNGFGVGATVSGNVLAIGAPSADYGSGRAIIFERQSDGSWTEAGDALGDVTTIASRSGDEVRCDNEQGRADGLFPCENVDLLSVISAGDLVHDRGANLNDLWGWTDPETGHEYVLAGRTDGMSFVDIADPAHPLIVGQLMRTPGTPGSWWRDVKVYKDHAYIVADGAENHGMQIFDLTQLRDISPSDMPVDFEPTVMYTEIASAHNVIINEDSGFAYIVGARAGGTSCGGQLHMVDIRDPEHPVFAGCYTNADYGGTHDAQCVTYHGPDADYSGHEICLNSNGSAFIIADVTDKAEPATVAVATYPNTAYTHQGWLSEDQAWFYMNDELDEMNKIVDHTRTLIWDVSDLDEPVLVKEFYLDNGASDHNLYIKDNFLFESNYQSGLRILDITDPTNPVEFGHFDTAPHADDVEGFGGSWSNYPYFKSGVIVVSSQAEGLFMVRKREVDM